MLLVPTASRPRRGEPVLSRDVNLPGTENIVDGRGIFCLSVGAVQIDDAVARAVLTALAPAGLEAALAAAERLEADRDHALAQCRLAAERARYAAPRTERRSGAFTAENRIGTRCRDTERALPSAELG